MGEGTEATETARQLLLTGFIRGHIVPVVGLSGFLHSALTFAVSCWHLTAGAQY